MQFDLTRREIHALEDPISTFNATILGIDAWDWLFRVYRVSRRPADEHPVLRSSAGIRDFRNQPACKRARFLKRSWCTVSALRPCHPLPGFLFRDSRARGIS